MECAEKPARFRLMKKQLKLSAVRWRGNFARNSAEIRDSSSDATRANQAIGLKMSFAKERFQPAHTANQLELLPRRALLF